MPHRTNGHSEGPGDQRGPGTTEKQDARDAREGWENIEVCQFIRPGRTPPEAAEPGGGRGLAPRRFGITMKKTSLPHVAGLGRGQPSRPRGHSNGGQVGPNSLRGRLPLCIKRGTRQIKQSEALLPGGQVLTNRRGAMEQGKSKDKGREASMWSTYNCWWIWHIKVIVESHMIEKQVCDLLGRGK